MLLQRSYKSLDQDFYHSDHLGSASWITDGGGDAVQHLQYLPYGERYVDQRMSGYNERFTFTGKERDEETGYGYFGARYMDHELMTSFVSVDRYADKYPFISPYTYCAWNPIRLIDPSGDSIILRGDTEKAKSYGLKEMQKRTKNLTFEKNERGYVTCTGEAVTEEEKYMEKIIGSDEVIVNLLIQNTNIIKNASLDGGNSPLGISEGGGSFMGNRLSVDGSKVYGYQILNAATAKKIDPQSGTILWHEISECFEGGLISIDRQRDCPYNIREDMNYVYPRAHNNANYHFCGNVTKSELWGRSIYYLDR